ncbi:Neuronal acetylcholine receptor subunit alpha-10 [Lamellibrachia satsuma]|nr:Neuronal acetylcholine receptor subunit alpha-10 [Lamellibrachia satsuma]
MSATLRLRYIVNRVVETPYSQEPKGVGARHRSNGSTSDLVKRLFRGYVPDLIPQCSEKVLVKVDMSLRGILDVDEPRQIVKVNVWFRLKWNDCRLRWNASLYRGKEQIVVSSQRIWIPDVTLFDSTSGETTDYSMTHSVLDARGEVSLYHPAKLTFSCKIDMKYFPFDRQTCPLKFASWTYSGDQLDLSNYSVNVDTCDNDPGPDGVMLTVIEIVFCAQSSSSGDTSVFANNGEWNLLGLPVRRNVRYYPCCEEPFPDITFYMSMQREHLYYIFNLVMPCSLITMVALLVFYLPPESGEKISLGITVLLSLCVFLLMVSESMPATSETVPLIAQYFASTIALVSLSCMLTVFVIHVHHKVSGGKQVPRWARILVIDWLGRMLCMGRGTDQCHDDEDGQMNGVLKFDMGRPRRPNSLPAYGDFAAQDASLTADYTKQNSVETTLEDQLTVLRQIRTHIESENHTSRVASDWRKMAMVLDRLFFIIVSIVTLVVTLSVMLGQRADDDDVTVLGS